jgi:DNA-binding transcriptional ArsR family regulator
LRLLTALLLEPARTFTVTELARVTGVPQPSVSREVAALLGMGLLTADTERGRRVVRADTTSPIFPELASLLLKTAGPKVVLERRLAGIAGVQRALIYGSWAQRYAGVGGTAPGDIDVLVVGQPDMRRVRAAGEAASEELGATSTSPCSARTSGPTGRPGSSPASKRRRWSTWMSHPLARVRPCP